MLLRYFYDDKLAHASYLVGCQATGEAIVIDPGRDIDQYLDLAAKENLVITAVTETHIHADFVSGARELAERVGARLYVSDEGGPDWKYEYLEPYDHVLLKDGDTWRVGNIEFQALHTPGHTPEHMSFLLTDTAAANEPMGIFTGDFLFVGDVGRPDLLEEAAGIKGTKEVGARQLFQSLQKIRELPDYLQVWPAHGAGSACGKALGAVPTSTLGYEKRFNWAFDIDNEDAFVKAVLDGQPDPPKYFAVMKRVNKVGPKVLGGLPQVPRLDARVLAKLVQERAWIVDTRSQAEYALGHILGTVGIPLNRSFNTYAGWVLPYDQPIYLIVDEDRLDEAVTALIRVGLDDIRGYFPTETLKTYPMVVRQPLHKIDLKTVHEVKHAIESRELLVLDVRADHEYRAGHIPGSVNVPLTRLLEDMDRVPRDRQIVVNCQSGGRSFVATTLLQSRGYENVTNLEGGFMAWMLARLPISRDGSDATLHNVGNTSNSKEEKQPA